MKVSTTNTRIVVPRKHLCTLVCVCVCGGRWRVGGCGIRYVSIRLFSTITIIECNCSIKYERTTTTNIDMQLIQIGDVHVL